MLVICFYGVEVPIIGCSDASDMIFKLNKYNNFGNNFETILFPQDMIQDIYKLHWNIIHKSTGVT